MIELVLIKMQLWYQDIRTKLGVKIYLVQVWMKPLKAQFSTVLLGLCRWRLGFPACPVSMEDVEPCPSWCCTLGSKMVLCLDDP
ncbi:uncharacterized protein LOC143928348 isoform X5 [Lithobates pipiens]